MIDDIIDELEADGWKLSANGNPYNPLRVGLTLFRDTIFDTFVRVFLKRWKMRVVGDRFAARNAEVLREISKTDGGT